MDRPFLHDQWCAANGCSRVGAQLQVRSERLYVNPVLNHRKHNSGAGRSGGYHHAYLPNSSSYPRAYGAYFAGRFGLAEQGDHVGHAAFFPV